jgi:hypothetical protein
MEREGLQVFSSPSIETQFDVEDLRRPGERLPAFASIAHELGGLAYYRWRGWLAPGAAAPGTPAEAR